MEKVFLFLLYALDLLAALLCLFLGLAYPFLVAPAENWPRWVFIFSDQRPWLIAFLLFWAGFKGVLHLASILARKNG